MLCTTGRELEAGDILTLQLYYRSVEAGTHGAIQAFPTGKFYDDNRVQVTLLLE